jgi:hypothetical protein
MRGNFCGTVITLDQHLTQEGKKNLCIILTALHVVGMNVCPVHRLVRPILQHVYVINTSRQL